MINMRVRGLLLCSLVVSATVVAVLDASQVQADQIVTRSLLLLPGATAGGSAPSGVVKHKFTYTLPTAGNVASIGFLYCTTATGACTPPPSMTLVGSTYGPETGSSLSFTGLLAGTTANHITITRGVASIPANSVVVTEFDGVTNQNVAATFFVRITSYTGADGVTGPVDSGNVAAATVNQLLLSGVMPESLKFCTGLTVTNHCAVVTPGTISFGTEFNSSAASYATSQMSAETNANTGYIITVAGQTLKSGSVSIPAKASSTVSVPGTSAWGMNIAADTAAAAVTAGSAAISPAADSTHKGEAAVGYGTGGAVAAATYKFVSGDTVADSNTGGGGPYATDGQVYTVTYMVDVSGLQTAGTYTTTLTYVCTATF